MVNEIRMVEWWSAGEDLSHAKHSVPPLPRFNGSTPITPQLQPSHASPPLGLGLVEYSMPVFSPVLWNIQNWEMRDSARWCYLSPPFLPPGRGVYKKRQHNVATLPLVSGLLILTRKNH